MAFLHVVKTNAGLQMASVDKLIRKSQKVVPGAYLVENTAHLCKFLQTMFIAVPALSNGFETSSGQNFSELPGREQSKKNEKIRRFYKTKLSNLVLIYNNSNRCFPERVF